MNNIKPISENLKTRISNALYWSYLEEATTMVKRIWKANLPFNGTQLTCNRKDIEMIFGITLTEELIEAEIFDFYGGANYQIVRKF
jgi:hypothetical protein